MSCSKSITDILAIRLPTRLDRTIESIPYPKEAILKLDLPRWKNLPLDAKVPIFPGPEEARKFSRQKLGKQLRITLSNAEFDLSDPYNLEVDCSYNALHDHHLAKFFSRPHNRNHLIQMGLLNDQLEVQCSPKEYNTHRIYWRKIWGKIIQAFLRQKDRMSREDRMLQAAEEMAQREERRLQQGPDRTMVAKERRKSNAENRLNNLVDKLARRQEQFNQFLARRDSLMRANCEKSKARMIHAQKTIEMSKRIKRCRMLKLMREKKAKERRRMKERTKRLEEEARRKIEELNNRWKLKVFEQKETIEREQALLACIEEERQRNIAKYKEYMEQCPDPSKMKPNEQKVPCKKRKKIEKGKGKTKPKAPKKPKIKKASKLQILELFSLVRDDDSECPICECHTPRPCSSPV